jgi:hypothetical protein
MAAITQKVGDKVYDPNTGKQIGTVKFDPMTGAKLGSGATIPLQTPPVSPYAPARTTNSSSATPASPVNTITSSQLVNPPAPLKTIDVAPPTIASGLISSIDGLTMQAKQNVQALLNSNTDQLKQNNTDLMSRVAQSLARPGETVLTDQAYRGNNLDEYQKDLDDIYSQIDQRSLQYRRQIEERQKNKEGTFGGATSQDIENLNREAAKELADLSVIAQARNQRYGTAKAIADRVVQSQLETQKNELAVLTFFYENNKKDLDKADERDFQLMIGERTRLLEQQETDLKTKNDYVLDVLRNGGPTSVVQAMQQAPSAEDALRIGGNYIGLLDRRQAEASIASANRANQPNVDEDSVSLGNGVASIFKDGTIFAPKQKLTSPQQTKVDTILQGQKLIDQVEDLYFKSTGDEYSGVGSGFLSRIKGLARVGLGVSGLNESRQIYQNFIDSNLTPIAKGLKGEVGAVTDTDKKDAKKAFPGSFTSPTEAKAAFETLRQQIKDQLSVYGTFGTADDLIGGASPEQIAELKSQGLLK